MKEAYGVTPFQTVQGFYTDRQEFINRHEAYRLALTNEQLKRHAGGYDGPELFSEDLW